MAMLPPREKYSGGTWEWTTARDYHDKLEDRAALVLEEGIAKTDITLMAYAANYLESCKGYDDAHLTASNYKNLGLAYARMVQSKSGFPARFVGPFPGGRNRRDWRSRASVLCLVAWDTFLAHPHSTMEADYASIYGMVAAMKSQQ